MNILSHRGYWKSPEEKNTPLAFSRSFSLGFGTETDLRDLAGTLVVSHDPPASGAISAEILFEIHQGIDSDLPLALNIKSDGLQKLLSPLLERFSIGNYFVFDMSIPDALGWLQAGVPVFTRQSEYEPQPAFLNQAAGIWLDGFHGEWWNLDLIRGHLELNKQVCLVSPELHGRDPEACWDRLAKSEFLADPRFLLCTDYPEKAREFFLTSSE